MNLSIFSSGKASQRIFNVITQPSSTTLTEKVMLLKNYQGNLLQRVDIGEENKEGLLDKANAVDKALRLSINSLNNVSQF